MQIDFTGHGISITEGLKTHTKEKFSKIENHFDHTMTRTHVTLTVEKSDHIAEITVHVAGKEVHAKATQTDMYHAIDEMIQKLDKQLLKHKDKITSHRVVKPVIDENP